MVLYKLKVEDDEPVNIYARDPKDIICIVEHYHEQSKKEGSLENPRIAKWVKKIPSLHDILEVEKGNVKIQAGMIQFGESGSVPEKFFNELQVTSDFSVYINDESLPYLVMLRHKFPKYKRQNLYKIQITGGIFPGWNFIPEDVIKAICRYELGSALDKSRIRLQDIARVKSGHPNIA